MNQENNPNTIFNSIDQRISKADDKEDEDFGEDTQLSNEQLYDMAQQLSQPESTEFLAEGLQFLADYAGTFRLPPLIAHHFYELTISLINSEHPPELNPIIANVIGSIQKSFPDSSSIDYSILLTFLFSIISVDEDSAVEAIADLTSNHEEAAKILVPQIPEFLSQLKDNSENIIDILIGISSCKAILSNIVIYLGQLIDQCINLNEKFLVDVFRILTNFAKTEIGVEIISEHPLISEYFQKVKDKDQIIASDNLLIEILARLTNPIRFLEKIDGFHFILDGLQSNDQTIVIQSLLICQTISENKYGIEFMLSNNIVNLLFALTDNQFAISQIAFNVICNIVSEGPPAVIPSFLESGLLGKFLSFMGNTTADVNLMNTILRAIQTITLFTKETGNSELIADMIPELYEALEGFNANKELGAIAIYIQEQLGEL